MSWDGDRSGSGDVIVRFRSGSGIMRVSPDSTTPRSEVSSHHCVSSSRRWADREA